MFITTATVARSPPRLRRRRDRRQCVAGLPWRRLYSVRNASDPQLPDPSGNIEAAKQQAGRIYSEWGVFTTAANCHCSVKCHPESRSSVVICQMTSELAKADSA
jgi:hypothetical protein